MPVADDLEFWSTNTLDPTGAIVPRPKPVPVDLMERLFTNGGAETLGLPSTFLKWIETHPRLPRDFDVTEPRYQRLIGADRVAELLSKYEGAVGTPERAAVAAFHAGHVPVDEAIKNAGDGWEEHLLADGARPKTKADIDAVLSPASLIAAETSKKPTTFSRPLQAERGWSDWLTDEKFKLWGKRFGDRARDRVQEINGFIDETATKHKIRPEVIRRMIREESGGDPDAIGGSGEIGLMQLMPSTARLLRVKNPKDPKENIEGGVRHFADLLGKFGGNEEHALAAYNAGEPGVRSALSLGQLAPKMTTYVRKFRDLLAGPATAGARAAGPVADVLREPRLGPAVVQAAKPRPAKPEDAGWIIPSTDVSSPYPPLPKVPKGHPIYEVLKKIELGAIAELFPEIPPIKWQQEIRGDEVREAQLDARMREVYWPGRMPRPTGIAQVPPVLSPAERGIAVPEPSGLERPRLASLGGQPLPPSAEVVPAPLERELPVAEPSPPSPLPPRVATAPAAPPAAPSPLPSITMRGRPITPDAATALVPPATTSMIPSASDVRANPLVSSIAPRPTQLGEPSGTPVPRGRLVAAAPPSAPAAVVPTAPGPSPVAGSAPVSSAGKVFHALGPTAAEAGQLPGPVVSDEDLQAAMRNELEGSQAVSDEDLQAAMRNELAAEPTIRADTSPPRQEGLLERGLTALGIRRPEDVEARRRQQEAAKAVVEMTGGPQPKAPLEEVPGQFLHGFAEGTTAGLSGAMAHVYGIETPEPTTTAGGLAKGFGDVVGFLAGVPLRVGKATIEVTVGRWLSPVVTDARQVAMAKMVARESATLAVAAAAAQTGIAVERPTAGGALSEFGQAAKTGALFGAVFGSAKGILPEETLLQRSARIGLGLAALDAARGTRPLDDRTLAQKAFDYGLNAYFLFHGQKVEDVVGKVRAEAKAKGISEDEAFFGAVADLARARVGTPGFERVQSAYKRQGMGPEESRLAAVRAVLGATDLGTKYEQAYRGWVSEFRRQGMSDEDAKSHAIEAMVFGAGGRPAAGVPPAPAAPAAESAVPTGEPAKPVIPSPADVGRGKGPRPTRPVPAPLVPVAPAPEVAAQPPAAAPPSPVEAPSPPAAAPPPAVPPVAPPAPATAPSGRVSEAERQFEEGRRKAEEAARKLEEAAAQKPHEGVLAPQVPGRPPVEPETEPQPQPRPDDEEHDYSSTQVDLPDRLAVKVRTFAAGLSNDVLAEGGREEHPHVTLKYGLRTASVAPVQKLLEGEPPITVKLGPLGVFKQPDADVLYVSVDSPDLDRLNAKVAAMLPNTETQAEYKPHVTIAYLKPGEGDKYVGNRALAGEEATLGQVTFSSAKGTVTPIVLGGTATPAPAVVPTETVQKEPKPVSVPTPEVQKPPVAPTGPRPGLTMGERVEITSGRFQGQQGVAERVTRGSNVSVRLDDGKTALVPLATVRSLLESTGAARPAATMAPQQAPLRWIAKPATQLPQLASQAQAERIAGAAANLLNALDSKFGGRWPVGIPVGIQPEIKRFRQELRNAGIRRVPQGSNLEPEAKRWVTRGPDPVTTQAEPTIAPSAAEVPVTARPAEISVSQPEAVVPVPPAQPPATDTVRSPEDVYRTGQARAAELYETPREYDRVLAGVSEVLNGHIDDPEQARQAILEISNRWHDPLASLSSSASLEQIGKAMDGKLLGDAQARPTYDAERVLGTRIPGSDSRAGEPETRGQAESRAERLEGEFDRDRERGSLAKVRPIPDGYLLRAVDVETILGTETDGVRLAREKANRYREAADKYDQAMRDRLAELREQAKAPVPAEVLVRLDNPTPADQLAVRVVEELTPATIHKMVEHAHLLTANEGIQRLGEFAELSKKARAFLAPLDQATLADALQIIQGEDGVVRKYSPRSRELRASDVEEDPKFGQDPRSDKPAKGYAGIEKGRALWGTRYFVEYGNPPKGMPVGTFAPATETSKYFPTIPPELKPAEPIARVSKDNLDVVYLRLPDGKLSTVNSLYWDHFIARHPQARAFQSDPAKPIVFKEGETVLGVLVPIRVGTVPPAVTALLDRSNQPSVPPEGLVSKASTQQMLEERPEEGHVKIPEIQDFVTRMRVEGEGGPRAVAGMDPRLMKVLGGNLYSGDLGQIAVKEMLQNAVDSTRGIPDALVSVQVDTANRTIQVEDTGSGMLPEVATKEFVDIGGSAKPEGASGGFGIAKVAILANADQIEVVTVALDPATGQKLLTRLTGSGDEWLDQQKGLRVETIRAGETVATGTKVFIKLRPEVVSSPYTVKEWLRNFVGTQRLDVPFRIAVDNEMVSSPRVETRLLSTLSIPGGTIDVYEAGPVRELSYVNVAVLNHGLPQFDTISGVRSPVRLPSHLVADVKSTAGPEHPDYPFRPDREALRGAAQTELNRYVRDVLAGDAATKERDTYRRTWETAPRIKGLPRHRIVDTTGQLAPDLVESIARADYIRGLSLATERAFQDLQAALVGHGSQYGEVEYHGLGLGDSYLGININGGLLFGDRRTINIILLNPYRMVQEVETDVANGVYEAGVGPDMLARQITTTLLHELTHQGPRGHDEKFAGDLTRNFARAAIQYEQTSNRIARVLARGEYDEIVADAKRLQASWTGGEDVLGKISAGLSEATEPAGTEGAPRRGEEQGTRREPSLPVGGRPETAGVEPSSRLERGRPEPVRVITTPPRDLEREGWRRMPGGLVFPLEVAKATAESRRGPGTEFVVQRVSPRLGVVWERPVVEAVPPTPPPVEAGGGAAPPPSPPSPPGGGEPPEGPGEPGPDPAGEDPGPEPEVEPERQQVHTEGERRTFFEDEARRIAERIRARGDDATVRPAPGTKGQQMVVWRPGRGDAIRKWLAPASRGPVAQMTAAQLRAKEGRLVREDEMARWALRKAAHDLDRLASDEQRIAFIDYIEHGKISDLPEWFEGANLRPIAQTLRDMFDQDREDVQALGTGALEHFIEDYFPHIWARPDDVLGALGRYYGKRPLEGPKSFLKRRTIPTTADGMAAGLEPVSTNPITLALLKHREMRKYIAGQQFFQDMKDRKVARFVKESAVVDAKQQGLAEIDDRIARVRQYSEEERGFIERGKWMMPEEGALILNNYLRPGWYGRNGLFDLYRGAGNLMVMTRLGFSAFHLGFVTFDTQMSAVALGLQEAGLGLERIAKGDIARGGENLASGGLRILLSPIAPFRALSSGDKAIRAYREAGAQGEFLEHLVDAWVKGGGRAQMDRWYSTDAMNQFGEAWRQKDAAGMARWGLPAFIETFAWPTFQYVVPRMKAAVAMDMIRFEMENMPRDATTDELSAVYGAIMDSVDDRLGQLTYTNLFWDRRMKDGLMGLVQTVGWRLGTYRTAMGGAFVDLPKMLGYEAAAIHRALTGVAPEIQDAKRRQYVNDIRSASPLPRRLAYMLALAAVHTLWTGILNWLHTGTRPQGWDWIAFRTGHIRPDRSQDRKMIATYMRDAVAWTADLALGHPLRALLTAIHPELQLAADQFSNRDFMGGPIRNAKDNVIEQLADSIDYSITYFEPYVLEGYQRGRREGESPAVAAESFVGITPAAAYATRSWEQSRAKEARREQIPPDWYRKKRLERQPRPVRHYVERWEKLLQK